MMHPMAPQMMMQPPSATGAHAAELIKNQLNSESVGSVSMLDVVPEVKPAESSSTSEGPEKRVIKLT
jgi:microcystin degradation protein MlrC